MGGDAGLKRNARGARPVLGQGRLGTLSHSPPPGRLARFPATPQAIRLPTSLAQLQALLSA